MPELDVIARLLSRRPSLRDERGFTLVELLIASSLGLVILGSATLITIGAARHNGEVANRTDATQRGRLALERMERLLRSQVCTTASTFPVISAKSDSVTFFADLNDGSTPVSKHTLAFNPTTMTLTDSAVMGSTGSPITFTTTPRTETLATDVVLGAPNRPVFRYYSYPSTPPTAGNLEPNVELVPPAGGSLSASDVGRISRVDLDFVTTGADLSTRDIRAQMTNSVFVRLADPNSVASPNPSCA